MFRLNSRLITLLALVFLFGSISLQAQRFRGGLAAGLTASQIDGDNSTGYNKLGLMAGAQVNIDLNRRWGLGLEMMFAQRGSQSELVKGNVSFNYFSQTFNYVDVPLLVHLRDWFVEDDDGEFASFTFDAGLSYSRFMSARYKDDLSALAVVEPYLRKNDLNYILGATFYASRHWNFSLRVVRGLGFVYNPNDWDTPPVQDAWYSHSIYFMSGYQF